MKDQIILFGLGFAGITAHWIKRYMHGQIKANFCNYLFKTNIKATVTSIVSTVAAVFGVIATGVDATSAETMALAFMAGYMANSTSNGDVSHAKDSI